MRESCCTAPASASARRDGAAAGGALAPRVAVVGAGPVGLSLALQMRQLGSTAELQVFDAQPDARAALQDPRVLALSEGSRQMLQALRAWPADAATAIRQIHVSQHAPGLSSLPRVMLRAEEAALPALGYTVRYGELLGALQAAAREAGIEVRYASPVRVRELAQSVLVESAGDSPSPGGTDSDQRAAQAAEPGQEFDLAVLAEGGAFHDQAQRELHHDYGQTALIGQLRCDRPHEGLAVERFTPHGPVALLPRGADYALVWCVPPERAQELLRQEPAQALRALQQLLPAACGRALELRLFGSYPLGLNARLRTRRARTVQLGNAAQTLHPVAGQGLNLGLRDSAALARLLAEADAAGVGAAMRRYDLARLPDRAVLLGLTDLLARGFTWNLPGAAALRAGALAALSAAWPLRRALQQHMLFGWRS
ncbi:MAG: FAD-dependent monooxygenase [Betaproteobacteria bacterium]|nr:FAD-dependent monooxygenase [Betaproteobacteria bacterium]